MEKNKTSHILLNLLIIILISLPSWAAFETPGESHSPITINKDSGYPGILAAKSPALNSHIFLPLKQTDVHLDITAGVVYADVSQQFKNDTPYPLEAVYVFPLPSQATITDMSLKIGERSIVSVVKEREEAKKKYAQAKRDGKRTALLEQERPNIFTTSVANLMPGDTAVISFSYMQQAAYRKGVYDLTFPMVVGQRYIPFNIQKRNGDTATVSSPVKDAHRINPPLLHPSVAPEHKLILTADITGIPIKEITSNTHAIHIEKPETEDGRTRVTLAGNDVLPDCDFNMKIFLQKNVTPEISFLQSLKDDLSYGLLTVFPPLKKKKTPIVPRDVIFLIDTSGSMSGESIGQAKAGLMQCLSMLRAGDHFTIVRFSDDFSSFSPGLRPATPDKIKAAEGYIRELSAGGGTEMQKALAHVLSIPGNTFALQMVVFLTDGDVGNEDTLIRLLDKKLHDTRLFTFGIGSAPNEYLMRRMAETGRGQSRFIRSHEDIGTVMSDFFKTLDTPVLTDIDITWENDRGEEDRTVTFFPNPCPDVFYNRPLQVVAGFPAGFRGNMVITGKTNGKSVNYSFPVEPHHRRQYPAIDKLYGRAVINDLMYKMLRADSDTERHAIRENVIRTAMHHSLVSKFTSRVAVEEKIVKRPDQSLVSVKVPVHLPKGWQMARFHPTATDSMLQFVIGLLIFFLGFLAIIIHTTVKNWDRYETYIK